MSHLTIQLASLKMRIDLCRGEVIFPSLQYHFNKHNPQWTDQQRDRNDGDCHLITVVSDDLRLNTNSGEHKAKLSDL